MSITSLWHAVFTKQKFSADDHSRAEAILQKYSASSEDYIKLWPKDKYYFFYNESFLAYGVSHGVALILDGASGNSTEFNELRRTFKEMCRGRLWHIAVLHADQHERDAWHELGLKSIYLGSEARVNIDAFCEDKIHDKHFRYTANKAAKDGLEVKELLQPLSTHQVHQLQVVSDEWLASGRRDYAFMMGYFDREYLSKCRIFAVYKDTDMVAYVNLLPSFNNIDMSLDHMRFKQHVSPAAMHYLLMKTIVNLNESGAKTLNLGLSPLSQIEENTDKFARGVLTLIRRMGGRYYSFAGLEQFKSKFGPSWEPTYLVHSGIKHIGLVGSAITALTTHHEYKISKIPLALAATAGLLYTSFPLAVALNADNTWSNYVSTLGQSNQPYSWLFNSLDVISGLLTISLTIYLVHAYARPVRMLKLALYFLLANGIGIVLAALLNLPHNGTNNALVFFHILASGINSMGYVLAVFLWALYFYRTQNRSLRHIFALIIFILGVATVASAAVSLQASALFQRAFIGTYAIWLVWFTYDYITHHAPRFKF